jgi:hypothetical protein
MSELQDIEIRAVAFCEAPINGEALVNMFKAQMPDHEYVPGPGEKCATCGMTKEQHPMATTTTTDGPRETLNSRITERLKREVAKSADKDSTPAVALLKALGAPENRVLRDIACSPASLLPIAEGREVIVKAIGEMPTAEAVEYTAALRWLS